MNDIDILKRRIERERQARRQAEVILEQKALELFDANSELRALNESLEIKISERTRELEISESRFAALIRNFHAGILVQDEQFNVVLTNQLFCDIFGVADSPESLKGKSRSYVIERASNLPDFPDDFFSRVQSLLSTKIPEISEELEMKSGRFFERDYIPVVIDGAYRGHLWQYRDITAERQANEALRRSEDKYRGIMENMELGLLEVDTEGYIIKAYPRFCEMVGYDEAELIGHRAADTLLTKEFLPVFNKQAEDRAKGKAGVYEVQIVKKDGTRLWVIISGSPIFDMSGKMVGSVGIHYDITYSKKLQIALDEARKRAEAAQEAEKQFLANMSHEIRTPLNAIIGMSHLLFDTQPTEQQKEFLTILKNSTEMLQALITDVLDLSKVRSGSLEVQQKQFDLVGIIRSLVKSSQIRLEDRPLSISADIDPQIQNLVIGDDLLLNQILTNLIGNAEKFTLKGLITVSAKIQKKRKGILWVEFKVSDSGIGIPKNKQGIIFQTFRQVDGDIKRKFGGTGLGLAIVKHLVELQKGTIAVKSTLGKGSTFTFVIPYIDSDKKAEVEDLPTIQHLDFDTQHKKVLVVEDNFMNRRYISTLLEKWQIDYKMAHNGRQGVEMAHHELFDLILMDIQMPEMDGYEATINIRNTSNLNRHTPIIALTASAMLTQKDKAFTTGMNDYVSKPFNPSQLQEKLNLFLRSEAQKLVSPINIDARQETSQSNNTFTFDAHLDTAILTDLYGDDYGYAAEMFKIFLNNIVPDLDKFRTHHEAADWDMLSRLAHKVKPTFGMVGLTNLEKLVEEIENIVKNNSDRYPLSHLIDMFEAQLPASIGLVKADLEKMSLYL